MSMKHELTDIPGIGPSTAATLSEHGIDSVKALLRGGVENLSQVPGFAEARAARTLAAAHALAGVEQEDQPGGKGGKKAARSIKKAAKQVARKLEKEARKVAKAAKKAAKQLEKKAKKKAATEAKEAKKSRKVAEKASKKAKKPKNNK